MKLSAPSLSDVFLSYWRLYGEAAPLPQREYRFAAVAVGLRAGVRRRLARRQWRDWRFDLAWPDQRVAVELEGGTWVQGRHIRPAGYRSDCEKYNVAQLLGWIVLRFTSDMLSDDPVGCIKQVLFALQRDSHGNFSNGLESLDWLCEEQPRLPQMPRAEAD